MGKKILWQMKWQLSTGEILPDYRLQYLKDFVFPDSIVLGFSGYYKQLLVKAGDITKLVTDRPSVTPGYYKLTRVQYNKTERQWQPRFLCYFKLVRPILSNIPEVQR